MGGSGSCLWLDEPSTSFAKVSMSSGAVKRRLRARPDVGPSSGSAEGSLMRGGLRDGAEEAEDWGEVSNFLSILQEPRRGGEG